MAEIFTPRPNWLQIRGGPLVGFPTAQQAAEIVDENKALTKRNLDLEQENATLAVALAEVMAHYFFLKYHTFSDTFSFNRLTRLIATRLSSARLLFSAVICRHTAQGKTR